MKIDLLPHWDSKQLHDIPTLCSKIIQGMQQDGKIILHTFEGKDPYVNGLIDLLDQLCEFWKWDHSKITLCIGNELVIDRYKYLPTGYHHALYHMNLSSRGQSWNKEKYYGMFIGRATAARSHAQLQHQKFVYKQHGLTSFHGNVLDEINETELLEYLMYPNNTYNELLTIKTYSDIDKVQSVPIYYPICTNNNVWDEVYGKIAIEIVCESFVEDSVDKFSVITEKTLRPMIYKRPFLLIATKHQLKYLKTLGFKTFDHVIDESYDEHSGLYRVDHVFQSLELIISSGKIFTLLDEVNDILEHNYRTALTLCARWKFKPSYEEIINEK